ncbi:MAG: NfeD family protein [Corynebacterium sp.]|nr:NfeD family protein [Corynebacterium sp.]
MVCVGAIIWFIGALVLAGLELAVGEFTLLMLAGAALATAGVSLAGVPIWAEFLTFAVSAFGLLFFLRPALKRRLHKPAALDTSVRALVGENAVVLEAVTGSSGQIRLDGSIWSARSMDPYHTFHEGDHVAVIRIDGATAVVWKDI